MQAVCLAMDRVRDQEHQQTEPRCSMNDLAEGNSSEVATVESNLNNPNTNTVTNPNVHQNILVR